MFSWSYCWLPTHSPVLMHRIMSLCDGLCAYLLMVRKYLVKSKGWVLVLFSCYTMKKFFHEIFVLQDSNSNATTFFIIWEALRNLIPLYNFKSVKNTHGGVLLLVKLLASACNFTKSNAPPWVFFTFFEFVKCYQIA